MEDIDRGLSILLELDPSLKAVADIAGPLPLRRKPASFASLANIITSQQVSVASAAAIYKRLEDHFQTTGLTAEAISKTDDDALGGTIGLSRPKIKTFREVSTACLNGLDLEALASRPAQEAHDTLCAIKGIGRWTADIFLLFCAGHPDIFPSGDLAIRIAVHEALELDERPEIKTLDHMAEKWAPVRGIAARLFWSWYRVKRQGRDSLPIQD